MSSIVEFLEEHRSTDPISFHMPGHKGSGFFNSLNMETFSQNLIDYDITEINGADNLFQAESVIRATMDKYKKLYEVEESFLLINGSSAGIIASILATVEKGGEILMARNCHKSVYSALQLGDISPIYIYPQRTKEYGLSGEILASDVELAMAANPDAKAFILPSPNYYGICSDIRAIAEVVHRQGAILIVDQAHGAHLKFLDEAKSAEVQGADIVINSTHKTLASFTQSAVLNICSKRVSSEQIADKLHLIESTSPSYIMMASLDANADILENYGQGLMMAWRKNLDFFYDESIWIRGLMVMNDPMMDKSKILLDMTYLGLSGDELAEELESKGIFVELSSGSIAMCMTGIGNRRYDYEALLMALKDISDERIEEAMEAACKREEVRAEFDQRRELLARAVFEAKEKADLDEIETRLAELESEKEASLIHDGHEVLKLGDDFRPEFVALPESPELVKLEDCEGRIIASPLTPYPPGVPVICTGERLTSEIIKFILDLRNKGKKVTGINSSGEILVGKFV